MPTKNNKSNNKSKRGASALSAVISSSRDQLRGAVANRYIKRGGISQIVSDVRELKRMINTEEKHIETQLGATTVDSTNSLVTPVGTMAEGLDSNQRTGRSIKVVRTDLIIAFRYSTGTAATMSQQGQWFNWYYVKYLKTPSSSGASAFSISEFLDTDAGGNYTPLSLPDPDNNQNFSVLDSGLIHVTLDEVTTASSAKTGIVNVSNLRNFHQTFNSTTAASICDNMTFLVFTAFNPINAGGVSSVAFSLRQWYVDN